MKQFPRFFYSNSNNPNARGKVLFHLNYPRAVLTAYDEPKVILWIDNPTPEEAKKTLHDVRVWLQEFRSKQNS